MNMNTVQTAVIQLLQIYMGMDDCADTFPKQVDWAEVYELAVKHNIGGILYTAIRKLPEQECVPKDIQKDLQVHFYASVSRSKEQDMRMVQVMECLNQKKIFHVLMKGWVLKRYYPIPELRTMGDVDFLIREEDRQRTHEALLQLGFLCTSDKGFVWCYEKGNTILEVHSRIVSQKVGRGVDTEQYYLDAISHTEKVRGEYTLCFIKEYHLVYLFVHAAKHFQYAGYGLRGQLDFALFIEKYGNELDWDYIWQELEKLGLSAFARATLTLCKEWFGTKIDFLPVQMEAENYEKMKEIIFAGGVYGYCGRNMEASQVRDQLEGAEKSDLKTLKWKAMIKMIFPDRQCMRMYLKNVEKHPSLLLAAWVIRWYQAIFKRGSRNTQRMKQFLSVDEGVREEYTLLKELDLLQ